MKIYLNGIKVAKTLLQLKTKVKTVSGIAPDSIIEIKYKKGTVLKYKIIVSSVITKKKSNITKVNFKFISWEKTK